ncbi:hypothetical protein L3Q82_013630 [Scortum barcoo]|uniref:Uncharacterized protein n=1 Tax=Scortum barcoo TaxID=214431 RepID=A0ACB8W0G9_9TELE|nr:hypothetical protein L3Q82_013630 [Scortum barcoo]
MEPWQEAASRQVQLLTGRLNELLSKGLGLLRSELGVDLGLKPELIPPWVLLLAAGCGLLLMAALWASACRALLRKRPAVSPADDGAEARRAVGKPVKAEEPKKKKKKAEKKAQANGRAVAEPQEATVSEEIVPHHQPPPAEVKAEKVAEVKKSKKKAKQAVKETKPVTADGKEPEEGTWETKVSNKEKREQRKKDKSSSDGSASPGGGGTPVSTPPEQPKALAAPPPASQKKKKGESTKVKVEKVEAVVSQVLVNSSEVAAVAAAVTDVAVKVPAHPVALKTEPWTTSRETASLWENDGSWTVIESTTEHNQMSLTGLGAEPPVSDLSWLSPPTVVDEWSGINGASVDPSSDWNEPSEAWGNYEEPTPEPPPAQELPLPEPTKVNQLISAADDEDDEKDKGETAADGAAKTKKKKKKKKKAAEEGGAASQGEEQEKEATPAASVKKQPPVQENAAAVQPVKAAAVEARVEPVKDNISQKPPVTQVPPKPTDGEPTAKQSNPSASLQQTDTMMISPWDRWFSTSCCLCCHVRTGTIILGVWYMLINAVVLLILLTALSDPEQYHLTSAELANDLDVMDDANMCIASAISLLMILICGMATYGAYKLRAAWIIPFFCYQIFDFALNTLVAVSIVVYPNTIQDYLQQLPDNFPYKEEIAALSNVCLVLIVLLFIGCILSFKAYLIACVWNCYRYVSGRGTSEILLYVTTNDTTVLLPPYDDSVSVPPKQAPPPYTTATA